MQNELIKLLEIKIIGLAIRTNNKNALNPKTSSKRNKAFKFSLNLALGG